MEAVKRCGRRIWRSSMKISVITAVHNCCNTVEATIASIAEQRYGDLEHIVVDGASTDGTIQVLDRNRNRISILVSEPDNGIYHALNKGIALATGEVVGFLHADDIFDGDKAVSRIAKAFEDPAVEAVYGDLDYVRRDNTELLIRRWRSGEFSRAKLAWGWMPPHPTFYVRRRVYEKHGGFDTQYRIAADYECMLRLFREGGIVPAYIPEVLVRMRAGGASNRSLRNMLLKSSEDLRILRRTGVGGIGALAWKNLSKLRQFL